MVAERRRWRSTALCAALVIASAIPAIGGVHRAEVTVVDRVVDAASGTFGVRLALPTPDYALPAGLNCRVRFREESSP